MNPYELNQRLKQKFATHKARGLAQAELAVGVLKVDPTTVGGWLNNRHRIQGAHNRAAVQAYIDGEHDAQADEIINAKGGGA